MKKRIHIVTDNDHIICPYCIEEKIPRPTKLNFISENHLKKLHGKTFEEFKEKYPNWPTITKSQKEKRSKARRDSQEKINRTYEEKGTKVGFADPQLAAKSRETLKSKTGHENFMKTDKARKLFSGKNNPMSKENPKSVKARNKVSQAMHGRESKLKGKNYEEIHGEERAQKLKEDRSIHFRNKFLPDMETACKIQKLELVNTPYMGAHTKHIWLCKRCNNSFEQIWNAIQQGYTCPTCFPRFAGDSISERELREFIKGLGIHIECNTKDIIPPKEIDIFIPDRNIAIEHNGVYYHSEAEKSKSYHIKKTLECEKKGIRLIHIFEDEWVYKNSIVKERLKSIFGVSTSEKVYARNCSIFHIDEKTKNDFLNSFHLQGSDIGAPVRLGAIHNEDLISVMTFKYNSKEEKERGIWHLNRFCSDYNYQAVGIAGKLLEYFKRNIPWSVIYTYADRRWSAGNLYKKLGFSFVKQTSLDYWYTNGSLNRIPRQKMMKGPDDTLTERDLRLSEGYYRIFGCGSLKYKLQND